MISRSFWIDLVIFGDQIEDHLFATLVQTREIREFTNICMEYNSPFDFNMQMISMIFDDLDRFSRSSQSYTKLEEIIILATLVHEKVKVYSL